MVERKHKPRARIVAVSGVVAIISAVVLFLLSDFFVLEHTRLLMGSFLLFGMGIAYVFLAGVTIVRLEERIKYLENKLSQIEAKSPE